jgi:hypothetical protein
VSKIVDKIAMSETTWVPSSKILVAGTAGPVLAAAIAAALPRMSKPTAVLVASVVTAIIAYLVPAELPK